MKVHLRAFQQIVEAGLLYPVKVANNCGMFEYQKFTPMIQSSDLIETLKYIPASKFNHEIRKFAGVQG